MRQQLGGTWQPDKAVPPQWCKNKCFFFLGGQHEVVALGTGEYNYSQCFQPCGRVLHDSHAIVIARRSLLR